MPATMLCAASRGEKGGKFIQQLQIVFVGKFAARWKIASHSEKSSRLSLQGGKVFFSFLVFFYLSAWKFANYANWLIPNTTTPKRKQNFSARSSFRPFAELCSRLVCDLCSAVGAAKKFVRAQSCRKSCLQLS
jgi:hypothetical protein